MSRKSSAMCTGNGHAACVNPRNGPQSSHCSAMCGARGNAGSCANSDAGMLRKQSFPVCRWRTRCT